MKKSRSLFFLITAFVLAQFAWMGLLGLWIYWYVSNYLIFEKVGDRLSPQIVIDSPNVFIFVGGIILIVCIAVAMFFIFRNLTVQLQLTRLYDNFIANVTHELKSPLSSIQLYLETLSEKNIAYEKQKEFFSMMIKDASRLNKLINTILEISKLEQKKISHDYRLFNAESVFKELIMNSAGHFKLPEASVKIEGGAAGDCLIDKNAMQIVFDNLTDNAVKYSNGIVDITVKFSLERDKIMIEFRDKGIGVPANEQKKIFNKFHRIQNNSVPNVKGTGLGLYWVKSIIKQHKGKIFISWSESNKGTCFRIVLPVNKVQQKRLTRDSSTVIQKNKLVREGKNG